MAEITSLAESLAFARNMMQAAGLERRETHGVVYWRGGKGTETIALVHGANDQSGTWAPVVSALSRHFQLIVPDLAGHGESEPKRGPISMDQVVASLEAVLHAESASQVTLVGNSMGAWVALLYTLRHPDQVRQLVLESGGGISMPLGSPLMATTREQAHKILQAVHGPEAVLADWVADALIARSLESPMLRMIQTNLVPFLIDGRLGEISVPTTLVWGANDGVVTRAYVEAVHRGISGSKLVVIDGAAHIPHAQQPERFVECLRAIF